MTQRVGADVDAREADTYVPDERAILGAELSRAILKVLADRLGPEFARVVHDELYSRCVAYADSCPDDQEDGTVLSHMLESPLWKPMLKA